MQSTKNMRLKTCLPFINKTKTLQYFFYYHDFNKNVKEMYYYVGLIKLPCYQHDVIFQQ